VLAVALGGKAAQDIGLLVPLNTLSGGVDDPWLRRCARGGYQAFTGAIVAALPGAGVLAHDLGIGAAWAISLGVAEFSIRRSHRGRRGARPALLAPASDLE
jgi:hypothetical protein